MAATFPTAPAPAPTSGPGPALAPASGPAPASAAPTAAILLAPRPRPFQSAGLPFLMPPSEIPSSKQQHYWRRSRHTRGSPITTLSLHAKEAPELQGKGANLGNARLRRRSVFRVCSFASPPGPPHGVDNRFFGLSTNPRVLMGVFAVIGYGHDIAVKGTAWPGGPCGAFEYHWRPQGGWAACDPAASTKRPG
jgi:hypothetical protein